MKFEKTLAGEILQKAFDILPQPVRRGMILACQLDEHLLHASFSIAERNHGRRSRVELDDRFGIEQYRRVVELVCL